MMMKPEKSDKHRDIWTRSEFDFVKMFYGVMETVVIAQELGRTTEAVRQAVRTLGVRMTAERYRPWTEAEKEIIRRYFAHGKDDMDKLMSLLPGRSRGAIFRMMDKLEIIRPKKWKVHERQILAQYYPAEGIAVVSSLPGRTVHAVRIMARLEGIASPGSETRTPQRKWSREELLRIEANMHLPMSELAAQFPGRTAVSVRKARDRLKKGQPVAER